jgi:hypothetical protein
MAGQAQAKQEIHSDFNGSRRYTDELGNKMIYTLK